MNIRKELENALGAAQHIQLNDLELDPLKIRAILINEAVPCDPSQDFYGRQDAAYLSTTIPLFQKAGFKVQSIQDILQLGIYITNAVKTPKTEYAIARSTIDVYKRQIRLRALSQVAALGMPVIHLGVDIDRPVAAPGGAQLPAPDSLQVGGKASFSGGSNEQIPSVLEKQAVKAIVLFSLF